MQSSAWGAHHCIPSASECITDVDAAIYAVIHIGIGGTHSVQLAKIQSQNWR